MGNVIALTNLSRFKTNCDATYSKKLYWHTVTLNINNGAYIVYFTVQNHVSTALTKGKLVALSQKYINGVFYDGANDLSQPLIYIKASLTKLQVHYISEEVWSSTNEYMQNAYTITDVVTEVS